MKKVSLCVVQSRDAILNGTHPLSIEEAIGFVLDVSLSVECVTLCVECVTLCVGCISL